jgi:hypothetical protein
MISTRNASLEKPRSLTQSKATTGSPSSEKTALLGQKSPMSTGTPTPSQAAAILSGPGKAVPKTATPTVHGNPGASKGSKSKEPASIGSSRASARREAHTNNPVAMPSGRDGRNGGGGGGGFGGSGRDGHPEMHEWMPVSAQQSRITRTTTPHHLALPKAGLHALRGSGLKSTVLSMFGKLYMEVMPSMFRRTPQEVDRLNRDIKKDAVHKSEARKSSHNQALRESGRDLQIESARPEPRRVMAGDLTTAFAGT